MPCVQSKDLMKSHWMIFNETMQNIEIGFILSITEEDLHIFHKNGMVSQYKKYDLWKKDF